MGYLNSARHVQILTEAKQEILESLKITTRYNLSAQNAEIEQTIKEAYEQYKKL